MKYLLDTNVISEYRKKQPNPQVVNWLNQVNAKTVYLSVITLGELQKGISKLGDGPRRTAMQEWLDNDVQAQFKGRMVPLDSDTLLLWGKLVARLEQSAKSLPLIDSLIAATALQGDFVLVTRNEADFAIAGVKLLNPWK